MKFLLLIAVLVAFVVMPQFAYANCTTQTIMINGKVTVCTVCYDPNGMPIMTVCN